jgi:hypothetical protein
VNDIQSYRKLWNERQRELRRVLLSYQQHEAALELFLSQHAMLHSEEVTQCETWSFEDEVFRDATEEQIRRVPGNREHSIAWAIWHIARIEDVTMNMLVAGRRQIMDRDDWFEKMTVTLRHTGNAMDRTAVAEFSDAIDIPALRAYRVAVARATRELVGGLQPEALKQKVDSARLRQVMAQGAVVEEARGIVDYWRRRNIAGLLLMPATRHNMIHLNEALQLKQSRQ